MFRSAAECMAGEEHPVNATYAFSFPWAIRVGVSVAQKRFTHPFCWPSSRFQQCRPYDVFYVVHRAKLPGRGLLLAEVTLSMAGGCTVWQLGQLTASKGK